VRCPHPFGTTEFDCDGVDACRIGFRGCPCGCSCWLWRSGCSLLLVAYVVAGR
jgi:hypothetical protein